MIIETARLILREYTIQDFEALYEIMSDPETAKAVRDWAFEHTKYDCLYSYMKYTNVGSYSVAAANGMKKIKEYPDENNGISYAYAITRREWEELKKI